MNSKRRLFWKHKKGNEQSTLLHSWHVSSQKMRSSNWSIKSTKAGLCSEVTLGKTIQARVQYSQSKVRLRLKWRPQRKLGVMTRLPDCAAQAAGAVSAYTQVRMEDAPKSLKIPKSECPDFWMGLPQHKRPKSWSTIEDPVVPLERSWCGQPPPGLLWARQFEEVLLELGWEVVPNWECPFVHRKQDLFLSVSWMRSKWLEESRIWLSRGKIDETCWSWRKPTLTTCICDALNVNANRTKPFLTKTDKSSNHEFLQEQLKNCQRGRKPHAKTVAWSSDMEGHAKKCEESYCESANRKTEQLHKDSTPCFDDHNFKKEGLESVGELYQKYALRLYWNACIWHGLVDLTFFGL